MSNPSKPVDIASPRQRAHDLLDLPQISGSPISGRPSVGTPPPRLLRQSGTPGTPPAPPIANIPPRAGTPNYGTPPGLGLPSSRTSPGAFGAHTPSRAADNPVDLDDIPDEEKARVLRRHLVSRQERQNRIDRRSPPGSDNEDDNGSEGLGAGGSGVSLHSSGAASRSHPMREDTEPFPMPYDAPGGDIT